MRYSYKFSALLCAMALLVTACTKDETLEQPQVEPAADGSEIIFGARAGFENTGDTRTIYSGECYTEGDITFERIDWLDDGSDMVEIYCAQAANGPTAHYIVKDASTPDDEDSTTNDKLDEGYLQKLDANAGALQWNGDGEHTFYAMYPSSQYFESLPENNTLRQGVYMDKNTLHGFVPAAQAPEGTPTITDGNYVYAPNMRYAYMSAKTTATREAGAIGLSFKPLVTALQITLAIPATTSANQASQGITISELQIEGTGIAGGFTANLDADEDNDNYPDCTNLTGETQALDVIQYTLSEDAVLAANKSITFTVFMRPGANINDIKVKFSETGAGYMTKELKDINILALRKNIVSAINLPAKGVNYDASNWMESLPNNFAIKRLSLPGTGGSFSYNYSGSNPDYYKEQTIPVFGDEEAGIIGQWEAGIRAFEIVSDRATTGWGELGNETILGDITCNKESVSITVTAAMNQLIAKVKNSDECAVVVFTYQPEGAVLSRSGNKYATCLKKWYDSLGDDKDVFIKYTPDLKLGPKKDELTSGTTTSDKATARGNIMVIVRANQKHEKDQTALIGGHQTTFSDITSALSGCPFVVIDGCGTAKDRWGARGYQISYNGSDYPMLDQSNSYSSYTYDGTNAYTQNMIIEQYMTSDVLGFDNYTESATPTYDTYTSGYYTVKRPMGGTYANLNFEFETDDPDVKVWYQEWQRVSNGNATANPFWFDSYQEKLSNVEQTFIKAINDSDGNTIYINSLCGFFISGTPDDSGTLSTGSTYGGSGGDIASLAEAINPAFSTIVKNSGLEQTTGPTGVILMDRVTSDMEVIGRIIANNYKHSLQ